MYDTGNYPSLIKNYSLFYKIISKFKKKLFGRKKWPIHKKKNNKKVIRYKTNYTGNTFGRKNNMLTTLGPNFLPVFFSNFWWNFSKKDKKKCNLRSLLSKQSFTLKICEKITWIVYYK